MFMDLLVMIIQLLGSFNCTIMDQLKFKTPTDTGYFQTCNHQLKLFFIKFSQNLKERPNRFTYNWDRAEKAKLNVVCELVSKWVSD